MFRLFGSLGVAVLYGIELSFGCKTNSDLITSAVSVVQNQCRSAERFPAEECLLKQQHEAVQK